jgi:hypothetical protein
MDFFLGVQTVDRVRRCITSYLLAGPACLKCLVFHIFKLEKFEIQLCEHIEGSIDFSFRTQFLQFF